MVPMDGVEPSRYHYHWILSPARFAIKCNYLMRKEVHFIYAKRIEVKLLA